MSYKPPGNKEAHDKLSAALDAHFAAEQKTYIPVFAGKTPEGERIVLYKHIDRETDIYLQRADDKLQPLGSEAKLSMDFDTFAGVLNVSVESPEWTGTATGTRRDMLEIEAL